MGLLLVPALRQVIVDLAGVGIGTELLAAPAGDVGLGTALLPAHRARRFRDRRDEE
jgi:hypothetical protein